MNPGMFAPLRVVEIREQGATLAWAGDKLFLPRREEVGTIERGSVVVVFIALDRDERPFASMRVEEFLEHDPSALMEGQKVELLVYAETDLGYKCIIDHQHTGMLYRSEVFQPLGYGSELAGFVKKVRADGKVDLILEPTGHKGADDLGRRILKRLDAAGGFLAVTDKTTAERIHDLFGVSKKKFKAALGTLYKNRLIVLRQDGIARASSAEQG
jgi:predicted RNA-binding protein (virulence factor B family)